MHRAERTSSKLCRERELEAARTIHHKKLGETRSAIDTTKPKTLSMVHMTCNKRKERLVEERAQEIEKHNNMLVNRMADVLNCSSWEFHPCESVEDVSYTVYHSPRRSPRKPTAPLPAKKWLNDTFRTKKLKQIQAENELHKHRVRTTSTYYKTTKLQRDWKQSVKYLKSICAYPLLSPSKDPPPENDRFDYAPLRGRAAQLLQLTPDGDAVDQDNLLDFYSLSLPTIITPILESPSPSHKVFHANCAATTYCRGRQSKQHRPSFQPQRVGKRPGLPSLDPLSPRFKWGQNGSPCHNGGVHSPGFLDATSPYNFKQCRVIEGVYFVLTVKAGRTPYGMTVAGYDSETCRTYELVVSKEHVLKLLRDTISIKEEFSVEMISRLLCDRLQYVPHVLYVPLDDPASAASSNATLQSSIFCMFHEVAIVPSLPQFLVSMASTEDGGVHFTAEHPITHKTYVLTKSGADIAAYLRTRATTPAFSTLEAAAVALLPHLTIQNGVLTWQIPPLKRTCMLKSARQFGADYYLVQVCLDESDDGRGAVVVVAYNSDECASLELVLPPHVVKDPASRTNTEWESILDRLDVEHGPEKRLRYCPRAPAPTTTTHTKAPLVPLQPSIAPPPDSDHAHEQAKAAATIQATMRAALTRKLYLEKQNAAHVIKTSYLRRLHQKKRAKKRQHQIVLCSPIKPPVPDETNAAVAIQKVVRGSICRHQHTKASLLPKEVAVPPRPVGKGVSAIQARIRGAQTRQRLRREEEERVASDKQHKAATILQARMRGVLVRNGDRNG
ncbi:hypothetical protein H310_07495 [Aphanomyces invadans]|uniref:Uncharacterized protein n=1 Tax=Aphanomyces invadans TaxID=157072 RepID=A0A024U1H0_9STRA|nr:hypothetical protein H310_07495 [Aphanomyces invadans]ETW00065.1 hypothetical protein H310_07495 [Aphanomyces invadans]|eukprot:XP_008871090.1 hypothetical protein H310_07495 [Aphanomyces invadans]